MLIPSRSFVLSSQLLRDGRERAKLIVPRRHFPEKTGSPSTTYSIMANLRRNPQIVQLARDLGVSDQGDCFGNLCDHALNRVHQLFVEAAVEVSCLDTLQSLLADALSVVLRYIDTDEDIERIADEFGERYSKLRMTLRHEFQVCRTEGLLLVNPAPKPWERRHLAIIDRRGEQVNRANFTGWHELAHLLVEPEQLSFTGLRRSPTLEQRLKDPKEQLVDQIAGQIAFYEPLFRPIFERIVGGQPLTFSLVEKVRAAAAPDASLYSTAIACVNLSRDPTLLLNVERTLKPTERRRSAAQQDLGSAFSLPAPQEKLRVVQRSGNAASSSGLLKIHNNIRVPPESIITSVYESLIDWEEQATEDQAWWERSRDGRLPTLPLFVRAIRRGSHVYAMVSPAHS